MPFTPEDRPPTPCFTRDDPCDGRPSRGRSCHIASAPGGPALRHPPRTGPISGPACPHALLRAPRHSPPGLHVSCSPVLPLWPAPPSRRAEGSALDCLLSFPPSSVPRCFHPETAPAQTVCHAHPLNPSRRLPHTHTENRGAGCGE